MSAAVAPTTPAPIWIVDEVPKGSNPPKGGKENESGVIIYVTNGKKKEEVARIAYVRRKEVAKQHGKTFDDVKAEVLKTARKQANDLNELEEVKAQAAADTAPRVVAIEKEVKALVAIEALLAKIDFSALDAARSAAEVLAALNKEDVSKDTFERARDGLKTAVADAQKTLKDVDDKIAAKLRDVQGDGTLL